jgi:hypothetical protein
MDNLTLVIRVRASIRSIHRKRVNQSEEVNWFVYLCHYQLQHISHDKTMHITILPVSRLFH